MRTVRDVTCPAVQSTVVIGDDAQLLAQVSCQLARRGKYLPVLDGPRLTRPDAVAEVTRRRNAIAKASANAVVFAAMPAATVASFRLQGTSTSVVQVAAFADVQALRASVSHKAPPLDWGRDRVGIGLLLALRQQRQIVFSDQASPRSGVASSNGHLVVCEEGEPISEVIAANYAFALDAGLCLIPEIDRHESKKLLEGLYDDSSQSLVLSRFKTRLRELALDIPIERGGSVTFISRELPFGFAFHEVPSTNLFSYPDLGISVLNGFLAEEQGTPGVGVAVLVDPEKAAAPEIEAAGKLLPPRKIFVRGYRGRGATVQSFRQMLESFPYDLLLIATHCGNVPGMRWTYEFVDSEGHQRRLVVDVAISVGTTDEFKGGSTDPEDRLLDVVQQDHFVSIDGVDWHDPDRDKKVRLGPAMQDFVRMTTEKDSPLMPIAREEVDRIVGSAGLQLSDHTYIGIPRPLACNGAPIVINNACTSWHELAGMFTFCNARAYIGTLVSVTTSEAHDIAVKLLGQHFGKPLAVALWRAQNEVYRDESGSDTVRRPYVLTGVFPQRLRSVSRNVPIDILAKLRAYATSLAAALKQVAPSDEPGRRTLRSTLAYVQREVRHVRKWL